ncbi:Cytosolic Fe-S cluster assembly factor nar1 [Orbilia brochopaga]|uniref:Cytosolic Fe-S cluster assembly factor NAR1 n=1 Tax=Orbilia brochopaga TaxID=3140254 RepID=A0AAV9U6P0_9PEZI
MSAILSADDLNDFISPGVACIKPVETLPAATSSNPYEVTTEDQIAATEAKLQAAQISLTDCLACSGCVTSAEAVLVSLQSHQEVLSVLDSESDPPPLPPQPNGELVHNAVDPATNPSRDPNPRKRVFVASVSSQTRASLAAALGRPAREIGHMIDRLLLQAISTNGRRGFDYVVDTNPMLSVCLHLAAAELEASLAPGKAGADVTPKLPVLTSECPGFVCYLEKTHPAVLPHLSRLKSPQALLGTLLKSVLPGYLGRDVEVYHVAVMPCFDKKLEASRAELTDAAWRQEGSGEAARDVDCVITTRELLQLAAARDVDFSSLSAEPFAGNQLPPIPYLQELFRSPSDSVTVEKLPLQKGTSGGYLASIIQAMQAKHAGSTIIEKRGRNVDVVEYILLAADGETEILKMARFYGFRNIQNLVRKLKPAKARMLPGAAKRILARSGRTPASRAGTSGSSSEYCYTEVMACPGGCTNGGGQLKPDDPFIVEPVAQEMVNDAVSGRLEAKAWLAKVDEAYYSEEEEQRENEAAIIKHASLGSQMAGADVFLKQWVAETGVRLEKLVYTTYRAVDSDVGKPAGEMSTLQAVELAQKVGGGW